MGYGGRGAGTQAFRRRKAAGSHRPDHAQTAADSGLRRGDLVPGQPYGTGHTADPHGGRGGPHDPGHRPPPVHRGGCGSYPGHGGRTDPRAGHPSPAVGAAGNLRRDVGAATTRAGHPYRLDPLR